MFESEIRELGIKEIRAVIAAIRVGYGDDFTDFNLGVLSRRISMAMNRLGMRQIESFCQALQGGDRILYRRLLAELTPPTTELLRDPSFWRHLRDDVIPPLAEKREKLRILQAAYGTGEELYSLLIVLDQLKLREKVEVTCAYLSEDTRLQIQSARLPARRREVDEANLTRFDSSATYSTYVENLHDESIFRPALLDGVTYIRLSPEYDLPLDVRYHLILCRNQFLYFNLQLGARNMQVLFDRLLTGGVLVLGIKEGLDSYQNGSTFTILNREESIYRKKESVAAL